MEKLLLAVVYRCAKFRDDTTTFWGYLGGYFQNAVPPTDSKPKCSWRVLLTQRKLFDKLKGAYTVHNTRVLCSRP